jgi:ribonuclease D
MGNDFLWVEDEETLRQMTAILRPDAPFAIDTEADSLHHYKESVSLVQLAQFGHHFLVDPLAGLQLSPLWDKLEGAIWILHGADFDLRMMRRIGAKEPKAVFDTMLGAQLLGFHAFGYAALVDHFYKVKLSKKNQKADWSIRPLNRSMLDYAVQDTRYLEGILHEMTQMLYFAGRLEWHEQACSRVLRTSRVTHEHEPGNEWRITGSNALNPKALAILKAIWEWREVEADRADLPVFKVMNNETILDLARWAADAPHLPPPAFGHWPHRMSHGRGEKLIEAVEGGRKAEPIPRLPAKPRAKHDPKADVRMEQLRKFRDEVAKKLELDASLIASKSTLLEIARDPENGPKRLIAEDRWCPWQNDVLQPVIKTL